MAKNTAAVDLNVYGAFELKRLYPKFYLVGVITAILIHLLLLGTYFFVKYLNTEEEYPVAPTVKMNYSDLAPPPSIVNEVVPETQVAAAAVKPTAGVPNPVEDSKAAPEQTLASQSELKQQAAPVQAVNTDQKVEVKMDIKIEEPKKEDDNPNPDSFIPVEQSPTPIKLEKPVYPELAQRAGLTGTVHLQILVSKEGKPMKTRVVKTDNDIFTEAAKEAAMKSQFSPAIQNGKPITCWVNIPFKFTLNK